VAHDNVVENEDGGDSDVLGKLLYKTYNLDHLKFKHVVRLADMISKSCVYSIEPFLTARNCSLVIIQLRRIVIKCGIDSFYSFTVHL
jgi:hypothetical protein